jgi:tRNA (cmo5U34)-methyltransferase
MLKSTVDEIRARFDQDVERFSNLETGQTATVDAALALDLITAAAAACTPQATALLDVGCGAGNFTLKMLERLPALNVTMVDLSQPMLDRARERVCKVATGNVETVQADIRELRLGAEQFDIILAAAVLHHLRSDAEWHEVFAKFHRALKPGGSVWIFDMITSSLGPVEALMRARYGEYLATLKDEAYRDHVFRYIEQEDTPKSLLFQLDLLRSVGFTSVEILHKNACFAAFGAIK